MTSTRILRLLVSLLAFVFLAAMATPASAQSTGNPWATFSIEGARFTQARNDVRIPPVGGTDFSIVDLVGSAPTGTIRVEVGLRLTGRQDLRFTYAPLQITGTGTPAAPILFAGGAFDATTEAVYKFSSYRATWRYLVHDGDTWRWRVGFTAFVRDARIALSQPGAAAEDTDVGFVPLGHVSALARLSPRWHVSFDVDGSAAPQGRAFDVAAMLNHQVTPRLTVSAGYRLIEGGADVDRVYTFARLDALVARVAVAF
jgi:hypothetical protein